MVSNVTHVRMGILKQSTVVSTAVLGMIASKTSEMRLRLRYLIATSLLPSTSIAICKSVAIPWRMLRSCCSLGCLY